MLIPWIELSILNIRKAQKAKEEITNNNYFYINHSSILGQRTKNLVIAVHWELRGFLLPSIYYTV